MPQTMLPQYLCNLKEKHAVLKPRRSRSLHAVALSVLLTFVLICICHQLLEPVNQDSQHHHNQHPDKAVAVVQYDSPDRISLLDCYLKRDLITKDGPLDSVIFFARPGISLSDSHALDELVSSSPHYVRYNISTTSSPTSLPTLLPLIAEKTTLYITIPATTVYIRPHALTHLINSKLAHPSHRLVIANSITAHRAPRHLSSTSSADQSPLTPSPRRTQWHTPTLRTVSDPPLDATTATSRRAPASVQEYRSLLWSRIVANSRHVAETRARRDEDDDFEKEEGEEEEEEAEGWIRDARTHDAFIQALAFGRLDPWVVRSRPIAPRYPVRASSANGLPARTADGAVAVVEGADVLDAGKRGSMVWEEEAWMDGMAVVAQWDGKGAVEGTDLLERWADYGREMVCSRPRDEEQRLREGGEDGVEL